MFIFPFCILDNTFANPYACPLTYTALTPWLGNCSRISDIVPKTEVFKGLSQKDKAFTSSFGLEMDEDTILQVLESKTVCTVLLFC